MSLIARCPAKVNLALRVLGRRADGYHELETLFQAIDLCDEIAVAAADELSLTCDDDTIPVDGSNLVLRAAVELREIVGGNRGARLHLRKRIPAAGGLGGGSSDAAGALLLLARHWEIAVSREVLLRIAAELGADVPFFLHGGTALGTGRGDEIHPLPPAPPRPLLLGCPPFGMSTAEIFASFERRLTPPGNGVSLRRFLASKWPAENDFRFAVNDLEGVALRAKPELAAFRDALRRAGACIAMLSGSGSTVFGLFADEASRSASLASLAQNFPGWKLRTARTVPWSATVVDEAEEVGLERGH